MKMANLRAGTAVGGGLATGTAPDKLVSITETQGLKAAVCGPYYLDPISDPRWAAFIERHPRASVFHSKKWLKALRSVYGYEPMVVTTCPEGSRLTNGIVFCCVKSWITGKRLVSLPFSDHCEPLFDRREELSHILSRMKEQVDKGEWKYVEIRPIASEPDRVPGFKRLVSYYLHSLDLRSNLEQLFRSFHKDCIQRKIRRAQKENLQYEEGRSEALLRKFYRLSVMTRRRQFLPPQPFGWFRGLIDSFGDDIRIRVASTNGVPVASILTLKHKKSIIYKYGCSDVAFNNLGGTALLFWKTIQEAKACGLEELELGRSDMGNAGLVAFKERWGALRREITYWTYPESHAWVSNAWQSKLTHRLVPLAPDWALKAAGSLLYPHIG
jgi:CelD/BcsL family acetyltransferase involved in cellulose biosynthesis